MLKTSFQLVAIDKIKESLLNPRKIYNEKRLQELIESVREKGILTPLLVRPSNGLYEIAAGSRRYRAAKVVDLKELPVLIREMTDVEFLEVMTIENLQRDDLHPLEEAEGYRDLMERGGYDVHSIVVKVGKQISESYIYQRLKLLELIPEAKKLFLEDKIMAGHAILIARLQPNQQKELIKKESGLYEGWGKDRTIVSVRDLTHYIDRNIHLDLNSSSFPKEDPDLLPSAGPCTTCSKRTGFQPQLFPDVVKKDTCTDRICFYAKVKAFTDRWLEERSRDTDIPPLRLSQSWDGRIKKLPEDTTKPIPRDLYREIEGKRDSCNSTREGIFVDGPNTGQVTKVCVDSKCEKHHGRGLRGYGMSEEEKKRRKAEKEKSRIEDTIRQRLVETVSAVTVDKPLATQDWVLITGQLFKEVYFDKQSAILKQFGCEIQKDKYGRFKHDKTLHSLIFNFTADQFPRFLFQMAIILTKNKYECWDPDGKEGDVLSDTAKRFGLNPKAIETEVRAEFKAKKKKFSKKGKPQKVEISAKTKKAEAAKGIDKSASVKEKGKLKSGVCRVCGCTEENACEGGCHWIDETKTLCSSCEEKKLPCLNCMNDATNGEGDCFRENFYDDGKGNLVCDSKKSLRVSAKDKKAKKDNV